MVKATHNGVNPVLYARNESGKKGMFVVKDFHPYFYTECNAGEGSYQSINGKIVRKIICDRPGDIPNVREQYVPHYEADIKFARRFLIDKQIYNGFECQKEGSISQNDIQPIEFSIPPSIIYLDIECHSGVRLPDVTKDKITCIGIGNEKELVSLLLDNKQSTEQKDNWVVLRISNEEKLLLALKEMLDKIDPDIIAGWNIGWDIEYLVNRCKIYNIHLPLDRVCSFDLLSAYRSTYRKTSNRLKDIALVEGITDTNEAPVNYAKLWDEDKIGLLNRNANHVRWCSQIDSKKDLIPFYSTLKNMVGLESYDEIFFSSVLVDTLMLRKFKNKYVLPSKTRHETEAFEGALVSETKAGIYDNIAVYDISRYYPSILLEHKLCPYGKQESLEIIRDYFKLRDEIENRLRQADQGTEEYSKLLQQKAAVKSITNAAYGYFAFPGSRLFDADIASSVTKYGREGLTKLSERARELGKEVIYYDTDSIFVCTDLSEAESLGDKLNTNFPYKLKLEKFFSKLIFTQVKKRYAGKVIYEGGKKVGYLSVTGFEKVRNDASNLTKQVQEKVLEMILDGKKSEIIGYLRNVLSSFKTNKLEDIAIKKSLSRAPNEYGKAIPDFVRGAKYSIKYLNEDIRANDTIKMIYCKSPTEVISYLDEEDLPGNLVIDYDKMISRDIRMKMSGLLPIVGLSWEEVLGQGRLL